ncbi:MAG: Asp-tRNA(Asn)/Glu-tRNA(Gln) amidotransferase subunit GatB [Minisyncoccota bacterium]
MIRGYTPTIGLEIHAELLTKTKMFCNSKNETQNDAEERRPNVNVCPVCMGHPGTLPVINKEAVRQVLRMGVAISGKLADYTEFDRKNYFYPDIPKGYQISQYKHPLVKGGEISGVKITRIHLEEDTARSTHDKSDDSLVDFNRAGVPLMELVTEPCIHDAETASKFAKELQLLLWYLKSSGANMEKGEMRVEANISVSSKDGQLGTKVEVKNLNSFKALEKAINFEIERHVELLEKGGEVVQETRGWDENKEETFSQRAKEESHDYRYFPDPDLPKLFISEIPEFDEKELQKSLPELPQERRNRYVKEFNLDEETSEVYTRDFVKSQYIDDVSKLLSNKELIKLASNYIGSVVGVTNIHPEDFSKVINMIDEGFVSARGAKDIFKVLEKGRRDPKEIAEEIGVIQKSDEKELTVIAEKIIIDNKNAVDEFRSGKESSLQFLIGQGMKESRGSANPKVLGNIIQELLK